MWMVAKSETAPRNQTMVEAIVCYGILQDNYHSRFLGGAK